MRLIFWKTHRAACRQMLLSCTVAGGVIAKQGNISQKHFGKGIEQDAAEGVENDPSAAQPCAGRNGWENSPRRAGRGRAEKLQVTRFGLTGDL